MVHVLEKSGEKSYAAISRADIVATRDAKRETPSAARKFLDTVRGMFEWALEAQHVKIDPTTGVKAPAPKKGGGFKIWTEVEVTAYETRWPECTKERVWLHVLMYTGLRRGDAVIIGKQHVHNGVATLRTEKGQGEVTVHLPILPILQHTLDIGPTGDLAFICGERRGPFTKESFGNQFKKACRAAGVDANGKAAHGLRKVAATRAADNGATVHQLMAIFGWRTEKEALVYTQAATRRARHG
jgi:integrase